MLAIRLQRTGRKGHAQFRMIVQDARRTPTSGRFVYLLGSYDPHTKALAIDKEKVDFYLQNGARPSDRVARLLKANGVKLPAWVVITAPVERKLRNPEKLRKNRPAEEAAPVPAEEATTSEESTSAKAEVAATQAPITEETPAEPKPEAETKAPKEDTPTQEAVEVPAETSAEATDPEAPVKEEKA